MTEHIAQVGGTHYEAEDGIQHWDIMEKCDVAYLEATATKYLVRWDRKGSPLLDLGKARSYLQRLLQDRNSVRRSVPTALLGRFCDGNTLDKEKRALLTMILDPDYGQRGNLETAIIMIGHMIRREERT
jgi:hypothetical protein